MRAKLPLGLITIAAVALSVGCGNASRDGTLQETAVARLDAPLETDSVVDGSDPSEDDRALVGEERPAADSRAAEEAWREVILSLEETAPGDFLVVSNPAKLAAVSDYVFVATLHPPASVRSFSTAAQPEQVVYQTSGFPLSNTRLIDGNVEKLPVGKVFAEVIAPVASDGLNVPAFARLPSETRALIFANDFTIPDPGSTRVKGSAANTTYIAPAAQGFVVEVNGVLLSILTRGDGNTSDFLTTDFELTSIDDLLQWLDEGPSADRPVEE